MIVILKYRDSNDAFCNFLLMIDFSLSVIYVVFIVNDSFLSIQQQNGQQNVHFEYVTSGIEGNRIKRAVEVSEHLFIKRSILNKTFLSYCK